MFIKGRRKVTGTEKGSALECVLSVPGEEIYNDQSQTFLPFCKFLFVWEENRKRTSYPTFVWEFLVTEEAFCGIISTRSF